MRVARGIADLPPDVKPSVATIGVFDAVHRGHQALMRELVAKARETGATPVVVTFDRHPREVTSPGSEPPMVTTLEQRAVEIERAGIGVLLVLPFDDHLRHLTPEEFVRRILADALGVVHVVSGANFRFGYQGAGTVETLRELGDRFGFGVTLFGLIADEDPLSSTLVRTHVANGDVEKAAEELGRPFRLRGVVEHGAGRGKGLGIPTANLRTDPRALIPRVGVYAGWVLVGEARIPAAINVGFNPTFEDRSAPIVEAHLLDYEGELYGMTIEVEFTRRLRDELKFSGSEELMRQVETDIEQVRTLLGV